MKLRTLSAGVLAAFTALTLVACSGSESSSSQTTSTASSAASSVTLETNRGDVTVTTPVSRAAVLDNRSFEVLEKFGVSIVAAPKSLIPATVTAYNGDDVADIGNHREPNLEALVAADPDVVISGQRFSQYDDDIAKLLPDTPLVDVEPRDGQSLDEELIRHTTTLGEIFGKEDQAQQLVDDFNKALARAKAAYDGSSTVMAVNVSGGNIGYVAPSKGRTFGPLFDLLGLKPALTVDNSTNSHTGDDISVEAIAESNPAWILVLDRDAAIKSQQGAQKAAEVIAANAALANTTAIKDQHVIYAPEDTYTNESIITYTEILNSMADAFEAKA